MIAIALDGNHTPEAKEEVVPEGVVVGRHPRNAAILVRGKGRIDRCTPWRNVDDIALEEDVAAILHLPNGFGHSILPRAPLCPFRECVLRHRHAYDSDAPPARRRAVSWHGSTNCISAHS